MDLLNDIPKDKLLHFFAGSIILFLCLIFFNQITSLIIVTIVAFLKELIWDYYLDKGNLEIEDFIFTILPCVFHFINSLS